MKKTLKIVALLYIGSQLPAFWQGVKAGWKYSQMTGERVSFEQAARFAKDGTLD